MFQKIIKWFDALWWETTVVTKIKSTHRQFKIPEPERTGFRKLTNGYSPAEILIPHHGAEVALRIPEIVRQRPPLLREGKIDYTVFPVYRNTPLIIMYTKEDHVFASCDGIPLSRTNTVKEWTKKRAVYMITKYADLIARLPFNFSRTGHHPGETLTLYLHRSWLYISYRKDSGGLVQMYQANVGQFNHDSETLSMAFAYARALLITQGQVGEPVDAKDELDLAKLIMSSLLDSLAKK